MVYRTCMQAIWNSQNRLCMPTCVHCTYSNNVVTYSVHACLSRQHVLGTAHVACFDRLVYRARPHVSLSEGFGWGEGKRETFQQNLVVARVHCACSVYICSAHYLRLQDWFTYMCKQYSNCCQTNQLSTGEPSMCCLGLWITG